MFRNFATLAKNREKQKKKMKRITFVTILLSVCVTVMAGRRTESKIKSLAQTVLQTQAAAGLVFYNKIFSCDNRHGFFLSR